MPRESMKFEIEIFSVLDENGHADEKLMPKLSEHEIKAMYEAMLLGRMLDDRILKLQREGRCGTYASSLGQEASQVGSAFALQESDWMFPYFREIGAHIVRKMPLANYLMYWMGDERGMKIPENINDFMIYLGDGATSEGDFHEGMNFAGVFRLPVVFVCQNNQYAISIPVEKQTASKTLAQKAIAYGFPGIKVDGNDIMAVYAATKNAVENARQGKGPTFIECFTYRISDHTTSDDASRYRSAEELDAWKKKDPIERLKKYMESRGLWNARYEEALRKDFNERIEQAVREAESKPEQTIDDMFSYTYEKMPPSLQEQLKEAKGED